MIHVAYISAIIASAVFWRMGGAEGFSKLYRRIGSTACMSFITGSFWSVLPIFWGTSSYFGWINRFLPVKDKEREYWWNFTAENLVIQSAILFKQRDVLSIVMLIASALIIAFAKVWMDEHLSKADIKSELWHGGGNALGLYINLLT